MGHHIPSMTILTGSENVTIEPVPEVGISHCLGVASGRIESPFLGLRVAKRHLSGDEHPGRNMSLSKTVDRVGICHRSTVVCGSEYVTERYLPQGRIMSPFGLKQLPGRKMSLPGRSPECASRDAYFLMTHRAQRDLPRTDGRNALTRSSKTAR